MEPYHVFTLYNWATDWPYIDPDAPVIGERRKLTGKEKAKRKQRRKMARASKRNNRR